MPRLLEQGTMLLLPQQGGLTLNQPDDDTARGPDWQGMPRLAELPLCTCPQLNSHDGSKQGQITTLPALQTNNLCWPCRAV